VSDSISSKVKAFAAITDGDWFRFLQSQRELEEVNFWQPRGNRRFTALTSGQPFLFKLHAPDNFIAGGGFFAHSSLLPVSLAWDAFMEKNGAVSLPDMRRRVEKYRRVTSDPHLDYTVGCLILRDPFFFDRGDWVPVPADFQRQTVQGKSYDLREEPGRSLWAAVQERLRRGAGGTSAVIHEGPMYGDPRLIRSRLGQGTFRVVVTDIYQRRCAMTGEKALPVLQAAHIRPVGEGGTHRIDNGLLLRSDVHTLFDRGYVSVAPNLRVRVSRRLRTDFNNGEHYYRLNDSPLFLPLAEIDRPAREFLEWHRDVKFLK